MKNWEASLEAYGTPKDFADSSYLLNIEGEDIPLTILVAPGYADRANLMKKQREDTKKRAGSPLRWENDGSDCFLCDNVGQADKIGDNLLLPFDTYTNAVVVPNRYAAMRGHLLFVEKGHQQTRALTLSNNFFANAIELSEKYNISILRNHPRSGMSIPKHDHFHSYPKEIKVGSNSQPLTSIAQCGLEDYGNGAYKIDGTRFDTIAFNGKNSLENVLTTIRKLEEQDKTFTFYYHPKGEGDYHGTHFITPHIESSERGGAGFGMYFDVQSPDVKYTDFIKDGEKVVYKKGKFKWEDVL